MPNKNATKKTSKQNPMHKIGCKQHITSKSAVLAALLLREEAEESEPASSELEDNSQCEADNKQEQELGQELGEDGANFEEDEEEEDEEEEDEEDEEVPVTIIPQKQVNKMVAPMKGKSVFLTLLHIFFSSAKSSV